MLAAFVSRSATAGEPTQQAGTHEYVVNMWAIATDTRDQVPPRFVAADSPILKVTTNANCLTIWHTNATLTITISSSGYEAKNIPTTGSRRVLIVALTPEERAPTNKPTVP